MLEVAAVVTLAVLFPQVPTADSVLLRGTVFDSIAARPLAGASIQFVRADSGSAVRTFAATSDSAGTFVVRGVPAGRYVAGFFHPMLDTLGLELRERTFVVAGDTTTVAMATPSPQTLIRGFCGDSSNAMRPTLVFGQVHDAHSESAVENASVGVSWAEMAQASNGLDVVERTGQATTRRGGFFAFCGVPIEASLAVRVVRARDSTVINTRVPQSGVLHLTLFVGAAGTTGRIIGQVVDGTKRPVATANARAAGRVTMVNKSGQFVLDGVAAGSQSVEVRAIGFAPVSLLVNVADGQTTEVNVTLERVVALPASETRANAASDHLAQYLQTKRTDPTGARFIEPSRLPGYPATQSVCALASILAGTPRCRALENCDAFFLNGTRVVYQLSDVDPDDILGVEVFGRQWPAVYESYRRARTPVTCGIVVFTRCPGVEIRCGSNPASQGIRKPEP
jgi:hypothetical protein